MSDRIVVVSNRLPLTARRSGGRWHGERSSGGLVAALGPVLEQTNGLWIGWPGDAPSGDTTGRTKLLRQWERDHGFAAVDLPPGVGRAFYEGYSNNTLWPLLHGFPSRVTFDPETWHAYRDANERFAAGVIDRVRPDDLVWVQDYQLMLLPGLLREARPEVRSGFFLHVPFPPPEIFRILPQREAILQGLLGADVIGFQTHEHMGAFRRSLLQILGIESRMDQVEVGGRVVSLEARPIGIVTDEWERLVSSDAVVAKRITDLHARHAGRRLILAVDRLDYTKGIPERLRAFRHFLVSRPGWRRKVTFIQVAVPSRERIPRYADLRRQVSEMVGEINGELGTATWSPVIYLRRSIPRSELAALYAAADVGWVASLRDGMNLVAKEYVACQRDRAGVLLLSELAGAAGEMGEAIRVNPYDEPGSAEALDRALSMPEEERAERQAVLLERVRRNNALVWAERSVADIARAGRDPGQVPGSVPVPPVTEIRRAFRSAARRACYLDYDGTLVPIAARPSEAVPSAAVGEVVGALARRRNTTVVIVSGRSVLDLERWFGDLKGTWLAAEHGALLRPPGTDEWRPLRPGADVEWKERVRPVLEHFAARAPGSTIEEKEFSLAWHFRLVEPEFGDWLANEVAAALDQQLAGTELAVLRGNKIVEVRFAWANKGEVVAHVRSLGETAGFELAIGDDRTDEDLFERLPDDAWSIRVGPGSTRARYRLPDPAAALALLATLGVSTRRTH
ncbi:MAG: bifunctional alpha,alpha-trehalose-phosphate synthase (UDP-forming)/trehalose-phosphatase [Chloroflexota bacterium]|nr:bifunctional alpha,alpha-trehalose-phosphate synthase (UDP-forming)/trehalose-phosphatase [Chloroflexota bacterium]